MCDRQLGIKAALCRYTGLNSGDGGGIISVFVLELYSLNMEFPRNVEPIKRAL